MPLGDGIRRNLSTVDPKERKLLRDAILELHRRKYPGQREDLPIPGGVSQWFKQDEIHQATHVHKEVTFLSWHRELVNHFEELIREVNPLLSLHYWDWTEDATFLFTTDFMGSARGEIMDPWLTGGFYKPERFFKKGEEELYRGDERSDTAHNNPVDPPRALTRAYSGGKSTRVEDKAVTDAANYRIMWKLLEELHDSAHGFIGGTLTNGHISFRDPIVFLLHSNVDRLVAKWQTDPLHPERLKPDTLYSGFFAFPELVQFDGKVEPWSTGVGLYHEIRPWTAPEGLGFPHDYKHMSLVIPPYYDTNHSYLYWTGDFTGSGKNEMLFWFDDGDWFIGTFTGNKISFTKAGNTAGFGNLADGAHPTWIGDFTGSGKTQILFNYVGDGNWWLGTFTGNKISFAGAGNTLGFGNLADGAHPTWIGDFTGSGKTQILFNYVGDGNWWLGTFTGNKISFAGAGNTLGFGNLADGAHPTWIGDFTGSGKTQILFNYVGDGNWWLGTFTGNKISFAGAGNTLGFGNLADGGHPAWVGDFTGSGKTQILFNYVGDGNWWLGTFTGNQISFAGAGNTLGFGNLADGGHPAWVGDFTGSGKTQILFNYVGDGNWWLGTFTGNQISFAGAGNTLGFGNLADGGHPAWVGDFTGSGKTQILFNYVGDGNWWLGTFTGNRISFAGAGTMAVRIGLLHGAKLIAAARRS